MSKLHILLVYGGESSEHAVSIQSARNVYAALDDAKYDVSLCYIDKAGRFWLVPNMDGAHIGQPQLLPELGHRQFVAMPGGKPVRPDVIFPVLHGKNGEDGTVQGLFELLRIPYVGPSVLGAALTMDKDATKRMLQHAGLAVVPWRVWHTNDSKPTYHDVRKELGDVLFVKPARTGSSVGVSKVTSEKQFMPALDAASHHDDCVLIERAVVGREIEVAILGNATPSASLPGEVVPGSDFYDYDDKYSTGSTAQIVVPAELDASLARDFQHDALVAYRAASGRGMARVDFLLDADGTRYINEVNSIPGFTSISIYPRAFHASGMSYSALVDKLIALALEIKRV